jgi:hypothetical protein
MWEDTGTKGDFKTGKHSELGRGSGEGSPIILLMKTYNLRWAVPPPRPHKEPQSLGFWQRVQCLFLSIINYNCDVAATAIPVYKIMDSYLQNYGPDFEFNDANNSSNHLLGACHVRETVRCLPYLSI